MSERVVLAYSGAFDAAMAIPWLAETYGADVVALTLDLGLGQELEEVRDRALAAGATRAHVLDVREEFTREYVLPALQAGALDKGRNPMAIPLAHPLVAKKLVEVAAIERATTVAHGRGEKERGHKSIEACASALNSSLRVIAAGRDRGTARMHGNLWGRSIDGGEFAGPHARLPEMIFATTAPMYAPDTSASVALSFEQGVPTAINGVSMAFSELIESLSIIAGRHGIGRIGPTEDHEMHEAPAAVVLHAAHHELESFVLPNELRQLKRHLSVKYADLVLNGQWFTPERDALDAFNAQLQMSVSGVVDIKLLKGQQTMTVSPAPARPAAEHHA